MAMLPWNRNRNQLYIVKERNLNLFMSAGIKNKSARVALTIMSHYWRIDVAAAVFQQHIHHGV